MEYLEEASRIWKERVPASGQADTVEGELLRAVEKFRDEAIRNGNGNWDAGFDILLDYLRDHLLDDTVFDDAGLDDTASILDRIAEFECPLLEDEPYDRLGDRVFDFLKHYGSRPHMRNPDLHR